MRYIRDDHIEEDIQKLCDSIFTAVSKDRKGGDPFWDQTAGMLMKALLIYVYTECEDEDRNLKSVVTLLQNATVSEKDPSLKSPVDQMFEELRERKPWSLALVYYDLYRDAGEKTIKSIKISLVSKLEKFILPEVERIMKNDELDLRSLGREKTALFAVIPDSDPTLSFLVSVLYSQLFSELYREADSNVSGRLKVPVHLLMDEFANVELPKSFPQILSTMRSRGISCSIIVQNIAQLKKIFDKEWESIAGNCDSFVYLGGNEQSTFKYVSDLLGKETIDIKTQSRSKGKSGSFSTNSQHMARELMKDSEVRLIDNDKCIVFIKGEKPVIDRKYNIFKDRRIKYTDLGKGEPYIQKIRYVNVSDILNVNVENTENKETDFNKILEKINN